MSRPQTCLRPRLLGLGATIALGAFLFAAPILLLAIGAVPMPANLGWSSLTTPDDGTVALAVIGTVAWIAWALFAISVVLDLAARSRGVSPPHLPGLALPQVAASRLVSTAALLFVAIPTAASIGSAPRADAAPPVTLSVAAPLSATEVPAPSTVVPSMTLPHAPADAPADTASPSERPQHTEPYTVRRGDSLWKIAQECLGDGTKYVELVDLNRDLLHGRPDFLFPGTIIEIPVHAALDVETVGESYVVRPGDTLTGIAQQQLGEADGYSAIYDASRTTVQPGGAHLTNPDLIRPGWRLTIPESAADKTTVRASTEPTHRDRERPATPPAPTGPAIPTRPPMPQSETSNPQTARTTPSQEASPELPGWVLPGLAGAGTALAGSLLLVLRQHRRTQLRYRRPGRVIAPPPPELRPAEKSAHASGSITAPLIETLDHALRQLAQATAPRLATAALGPDRISLHLVDAAELPAPWAGSGTNWSIPVADIASEHDGEVPPYPLLVSLGQSTDGTLVFLNLEEVGCAVVTGDEEKAAALGRHIAAELALNPWSTLVEIDTIGIGAELAEIDPLRHRHHDERDAGFLDTSSARPRKPRTRTRRRISTVPSSWARMLESTWRTCARSGRSSPAIQEGLALPSLSRAERPGPMMWTCG
jgi:LysM repeat protein